MANRIFYHVYSGEGTFMRSFASLAEAKDYIARQKKRDWNIKKVKRGFYV